MSKKRVIISVSNDLYTDQRVHKTAISLQTMNYSVLMVGRKLKSSVELPERSYPVQRMKLMFEKGLLFYAELNIRLFFFLLFSPAELLVANDLDTLLPNFIVSKIKRTKLVYDTHEYFTGVPEIEHRKFVKFVWKTIEKWIFPRLKHVYTVNDSIAALYETEYTQKIGVVRNIPLLSPEEETVISEKKETEKENPLSLKKIIIYQGAGINIDRGVEEAVLAMHYVHNAFFLIIGSGDVLEHLKKTVQNEGLSDIVFFIPKLPYQYLRKLTSIGDVALTLDKDTNINYRYSLPNKLFDYIHAGVPVLASPRIEVRKIIERYNVGTFIENHSPQHIAEKINAMLADVEQQKIWKQNCRTAAQELCWENEEKKLIAIYTEATKR